MVGKYPSQCVAIIVISGNEMQGHPEGGQQLAQSPVFLLAARVNEVAGRKDQPGCRPLPHQMRDAARKGPASVVEAVGEAPFGTDMEVRDLGDDHH